MAFSEKDIDLKDIDLKDILQQAINQTLTDKSVDHDVQIANLKDEQYEIRNEINNRDETINKLQEDIRKLQQDKNHDVPWQKALSKELKHVIFFTGVVGLINIIFAYFVSR